MIAASPDALPNDVNALHALLLAERAAKRLLMEERDALNAANEKLDARVLGGGRGGRT